MLDREVQQSLSTVEKGAKNSVEKGANPLRLANCSEFLTEI
jgi:hypothetical protein